MTLCPYKWCLYFVTAWIAIYYMLESLKWYQVGEKGKKLMDEVESDVDDGWDSEEEEENEMVARRIKVE